MNEVTQKFLDIDIESIPVEMPDHTDYKAQLEVQNGNESVLRRRIAALERENANLKRDPRFDVHAQMAAHSLDYQICIRIDSMLLRRGHPGGPDHKYLEPIARDIMYKAMGELQKIIDPRFGS